jgi:Lipase (class 3)
MSVSNTTDLHTTARSFTAKNPARRAFGDLGPALPAIDDLQTAAYDARLAFVMSVIATWAYADEKALAAKLVHYGIEGAHVRRISVQNDALLVVATAYLIQSRSGRVGVLAFRGTDPASVITILSDAEAMQRPFGGHMVHAGFFANVEALWDDVTELLEGALAGKHFDNDGQPVALEKGLETLYVTGHSLGGAMAVLAASRLLRNDYASWDPAKLIRGVYTFGQPMVGDHGFAEACERDFQGRLFRHVYRSDVVPQLPPRSRFDYAHTGREWRSPAVDHAWVGGGEPSTRAWLPAALIGVSANALQARLVPNAHIGHYDIDDHMPANYLDVSRVSANHP